MLKISELSEATGISKPTILFYVKMKLLPKPVKTSPNMAFYPSSLIERIKWIKKMQAEHQFTLAQIRSILKERDRNRDVQPVIEFIKEFCPAPQGKVLTRKEFLEATGLSEKELTFAMEKNILFQNAEDGFDQKDLHAGKQLKQALEFGISFDMLSFYPRLAREAAAHDMIVRDKVLGEMPYEEALSSTIRMAEIARSMREYIFDQFFLKFAYKEPLVPHKD